MILEALSKRMLLLNCTTNNLPAQLTVYCGLDATKDSLHIGHLIPLNILRIFKKHGHKVIVLLGSATTLIGDPSWKTESRPMLSRQQVQRNLDCLTTQIQKLVQPDHIVYNHEWLEQYNVIDFMRDVGAHFSVNQLVKLETFENRLNEQRNLTFLEFVYPLMQGYDFVHLHRKYGCNVQLGASDQWGNIIQGIQLAHKIDRAEVYGITNELLTTSSGAKMGKSVSGAVFLDEKLMSIYDFWQFWRNIDDAGVRKFMLQLTDIETDVINDMKLDNVAELTHAKKMLADNITSWVHGAEAAHAARIKAEEVFEHGNIVDEVHVECMSIAQLLQHLNLASSASEAKRHVVAGAIKINNAKIVDPSHMLTAGTHTICFAKKHRFKITVK